MKLGNVVWFTDHPRPFLVHESFCMNPECACNEVSLIFREIDDEGSRLSQPQMFSIRVDLETWEECNPPQRSAGTALWVEDFLTSWPEARRAELKQRFERRKREARRMAEYILPAADILEGTLVPYADLANEAGALSSGGRNFSFRLLVDDRVFLVEDLYCANPECVCDTVHLQFWEVNSPPHNRTGMPTVSKSFLGTVSLSGRTEVKEVYSIRADLANKVLSEWREQYGNELPMFEERYREVKAVGERSLKSAGTLSPWSALPSFPLVGLDEDLAPVAYGTFADDSAVMPRRVGRNDLCPCGSGKKFKKCCGREKA